MSRWVLSYKKPAGSWNEALPLGNGMLGVMSYGCLEKETLELNLDTLWSGDGSPRLNPHGRVDLERLRKQLIDQNYQGAEDTCRKYILGNWTDAYLPAGQLNIRLSGTEEEPHGYMRQLSFDRAIETVESDRYTRELFVSMADPLLAIHYHASCGQRIQMEISLESEIRHELHQDREDMIMLSGRAPSYVAPPYYDCAEPVVYEDGKGLLFTLAVKAIVLQGSVSCCDGKLLIDGEKDVFIYFTGVTGFGREQGREELIKECEELVRQPEYELLKTAHLREYRSYFDRMDLSLVDTPENRSIERMFHYARYLMICCSKPGSQCANLQGIWNNRMRAPWSSNYTVNINTEMNYWMAERCNLSECQEPLFDLIYRAAENGRQTASKVYGLTGWVSHHNLDLWGHSGPVGYFGQDEDPCSYAMWPMSSGWLCRHLWEHYCYTQDQEFLRYKAYPVIEGAVRFYLDFLFPYGEYYVTGPSTSPENRFYDDRGEAHSVGMASTMDISILKELFGYYLEMCKVLGISGLAGQVQHALEKLPPFQIGRHGQLQEWLFDYQEMEVHHRHVSHLYALYPGNLITEQTPELLDACRVTLERRGNEGTGWCMAWKACLWARLRDGERALALLRKQLRVTREERIACVGGGIYPNLLCAHPPFQIDGNFGFAAAIAEMLLQSDGSSISFLPALPKQWKAGRVRGMRVQRGITVDFGWQEGKIYRMKLRAIHETPVILQYNGVVETVLLQPGKELLLEPEIE